VEKGSKKELGHGRKEKWGRGMGPDRKRKLEQEGWRQEKGKVEKWSQDRKEKSNKNEGWSKEVKEK
jgi:hypothetical protein